MYVIIHVYLFQVLHLNHVDRKPKKMAIIRHMKYVGLYFSVLWCLSAAVTSETNPEHALCPSIPNCHCPEPRLVICHHRNLSNLALPESTTNIHFENIYGDSFNISRLQTLKWRDSDITVIKGTIVSPINLEILDFGGNQISNLQYNEFQNFTKLKFLNLSSNLIQHLSRNCFMNLDLLEELYLSHNNLIAIPFQVFGPLYNLKTLDLSNNFMVSFLDHFFRPNKHIETLLLNHNRISKLTPNALSDLIDIKMLDLSDNHIRQFPKGIFQALRYLEYLNIGKNPLSHLNLGIYSGLQNLKFLNMGDNNLTKLPPEIFYKLNKLETLLLDGTQLEIIHNIELYGLTNLHTLKIRDNKKLRKIENRVFFDTPKIRNLNISGNALAFLPLSFLNLTEIDKIDMGGNAWACDCRMKWFASWAEERRTVFKSALSCGPGSYPNDMLLILHHQNCTVPRLVHKTPTTR